MENWNNIHRYLNNEATADERKELENWLRKDSENTKQFNEIKAIWEISGRISSAKTFDSITALASVHERIKKESNVKSIGGSNFNMKWALRIAAVLVISLLSIMMFYKSNIDNEFLTAQTFEEAQKFILPDSSQVWLNANSKLIYPKEFDSEFRSVTLEQGEAFFDVTHDKKHPFVIDNTDFEIRVLGTSFNVKSYPHSNEITVTVSTGTVAFKSNKLEKELFLTKNESGILNRKNNDLKETLVSNQNIMAWRTRRLLFKDEQLTKVCEVLNDYFHTNIAIMNDKLTTLNFTGNFNEPKLNDILKVLENTLEVKITSSKNQIQIYEIKQ